MVTRRILPADLARRPVAACHVPVEPAITSTLPRPKPVALVVALAALISTVLGLVVPAAGHAAGDPSRAWLRADGEVVTIDWVAEGDDATAIARAIGLLPIGAVGTFDREPEDAPTTEQRRALSASPELEAYLLEHVRIHQDGRACEGVAEPATDFIADGARFRFTCPAVVDQAEVRITLLHDEDPAHRTVGVDGSDQRTIHTASQPTHMWDFTPGAGERNRPTAVLVVGLVLAVAGAIGSMRLLVSRRPEVAPDESHR